MQRRRLIAVVAVVEGDQGFVLYCHPEHWTEHPRANWMYPAALLAPQELGRLGWCTWSATP